MGKLYIFAIGGTGSRVLKSLTMLLATGVKINASEIVPIIIDPDNAAGDLTRTVEYIRDYQAIRNHLKFTSNNKNAFWGTNFNCIVPGIVFPIQNTQNSTFSNFINYQGLNVENQALASILFSQNNLNSNMQVGFKGNPNIGSVVLNQFQNSNVFASIASTFKQGDRIFIISSIFGGTGASGFPLLIKNLRNLNTAIPGGGFVKDAPIGAITVLPYFSIRPQSKNDEINSSTFISKSKSALSYYEKNLNEANVLYYVSDTDNNKQYEYSVGGKTQKNDAHFIEMLSALSIIDFMNVPNGDNSLINQNGKPQQPTTYKEYGLLNDSADITFDDLSEQTNSMIGKPLTQFLLFVRYFRDNSDYQSYPWAKNKKFDDNFYSSDFFTKVKVFNDQVFNWFEEMSSNNRSFTPYQLKGNKNELFEFVKGVKPAKLMTFDSNYDLFNSYLNKTEKELGNGDMSKEESFVELFYRATENLTKDKLNM